MWNTGYMDINLGTTTPPINPTPPQESAQNIPTSQSLPPVSPPQPVQPMPAIQQNETEAHSSSLLSKLYNYANSVVVGKRNIRVLLIFFLISFIATIVPTYKLIRVGYPFITNLETTMKAAVDEVFPEELEITLKNGKASTNVVEPYYITISEKTLNNIFHQEISENIPVSKSRILTIDTSANAEDFDRYQSYALLTKNSLVYYNDDTISIQSLSTYPDMTITKSFILDKINELNEDNRIVNFLTIALFIAPLFFLIGYFIYYTVELLIGTFLAWIINKILNTSIKFSRLFKLVGLMYIITSLTLLIVSFLPTITMFYFWLYTALDVFILSAIYVFLKIYKKFNQGV